MAFKKAVRTDAFLRIGIAGPSGSGKTYTALRLAHLIGRRIAVIDTERKSASLYAGEHPDGPAWDFDALDLDTFEPGRYTNAIAEAVDARYDVLVIDSLTHAWSGVGGMLEQVDAQKGGSSFNAWRNVTPQHTRLVDAMLQAPLHVVFTVRSKTEFVQEKDPKTGKIVPRKIGMAPVFRDGIEYESTIFLDADIDHTIRVSKTRCSALDGQSWHKPGPELARPILAWLREVPTAGVRSEPVAPVPDPIAPTPPTATADELVAALQTIEVHAPDLDRFRAAKGKPPLASLTAEQRAQAFAAYLPGQPPRRAFDAWLAENPATARQPGEEG